MKKVASLILASVLGGAFALGGYLMLDKKEEGSIGFSLNKDKPRIYNTNYIPTTTNNNGEVEAIDFTKAAEETVNAVVHVKNMAIRSSDPFEEFFFGRRSNSDKPSLIGAGSGVIISPDGYIVTNNHVIQGASDIEVTLNNQKTLKAEVVGSDAQNDIALLRVQYDNDLPHVPFGNSDNIKIGEWVLAVGNPLNLTSTVTAGIISAKGRDLQGNNKIESFIQTDAAVNSGNSGGALVNTRGELIGINTAITSRTGSYEGYSFAVPSNIVKKVIDDLLEFGNVQEALIGFTADLDKSKNIEGVIVGEVSEEGSADKAGIKVNDVIIGVNNVKIKEFSDLKGQLSAKRPGEKVDVTILRDGNQMVRSVTLMKKDFVEVSNFGIVLKDLTKTDKKVYGISKGAKIITNNNQYLNYYGVKKDYIISKINKQEVANAEEAKQLLESSQRNNSPLYLEVINLKGETERYAFRQ